MSDLTQEQRILLFNIRGRFSDHGHVVHELPDGGFLVCKWGMHRHCPSLAELQAAARQMLGCTGRGGASV